MSATWPFWKRYLNLAQPRLGAKVIATSDDFFGAASRLIEPLEPVFIPGKYDDHGKWMDGWESRRRRDDGHDWCVIGLGSPSRLFGVDIATHHFNGNQPESASIDAARATSSEAPAAESEEWFELLARVELGPDAGHRHALPTPAVATHLRLNIFPDGGVARLRAFGVVERDWSARPDTNVGTLLDLGAVEHGGCVLAASDEHFGIASNLLLPGRGINMGDGWETARRRGPGHDWCVLTLGCPGSIEQIEIDTAYFKGNFPHECSVEAGLFAADGDPLTSDSRAWKEILSKQQMRADDQRRFDINPNKSGPYSHVRLNMFPDGGVSRLRVMGRPSPVTTAVLSAEDNT